MSIILPFQDLPGECLSTGPSQGLVYAIDEDIVLKVPFQYEVSLDTSISHCWDLSIRSFIAMQREMAIYDALQVQPHRNFAQRLGPGSTDYLFMERLDPLEKVWSVASRQDRCQWALDLLDATSWLEKLGFVNGDLAVRNLGVDRANTLKVFDFGSSSPSEYSTDVRIDHFNLATCLHFILSGVDPFAGVQSRLEAIQMRDQLEAGRWTIAEGAEVIEHVIQDGWTGRVGTKAFKDLFDQVASILGAQSLPLDLKAGGEHYQCLQLRCQNWLRNTPNNPLWKSPDEYVAACRDAGHERNLDDWQ